MVVSGTQRSANQFRIVWKLIEIESMITGGGGGSEVPREEGVALNVSGGTER